MVLILKLRFLLLMSLARLPINLAEDVAPKLGNVKLTAKQSAALKTVSEMLDISHKVLDKMIKELTDLRSSLISQAINKQEYEAMEHDASICLAKSAAIRKLLETELVYEDDVTIKTNKALGKFLANMMSLLHGPQSTTSPSTTIGTTSQSTTSGTTSPSTASGSTSPPSTTSGSTSPPTTSGTTSPPTTSRSTSPPTTSRSTSPPTTSRSTSPPTTTAETFCPPPAVMGRSMPMTRNKTAAGDSVKYTCPDGYTMCEQASLTCLESGQWEAKTFNCSLGRLHYTGQIDDNSTSYTHRMPCGYPSKTAFSLRNNIVHPHDEWSVEVRSPTNDTLLLLEVKQTNSYKLHITGDNVVKGRNDVLGAQDYLPLQIVHTIRGIGLLTVTVQEAPFLVQAKVDFPNYNYAYIIVRGLHVLDLSISMP